MTNEEIFEAARKKREQQKAEEESRRGGFKEIDYAPLLLNSYSQVRVLGLPSEYRDGDSETGLAPNPTYPKNVFMSSILGDDGKKFFCIWPDKAKNGNWILYRILAKITEYEWDKVAKAKNFIHKNSHPELFNRVAKNNKIDNNMEKGWAPRSFMVMNVLDRAQMAAHREKKHAFILSKSNPVRSATGAESLFHDRAVTMTVYDALMDTVGAYGPYTNYDVIIKRLKDEPYYTVQHPDERKRFADFVGFKPEFAEAPLTEEELSWELYDLDALYPVTKYKTIMAKLREFILQFDREFGTSFLVELDGLVKEEERQNSSNQPTAAAADSPSTTMTGNYTAPVQAPAPAPVQAAPAAPAPVTTSRRTPVQQAAPAAPAGDPRRALLLQNGFKNEGLLTDDNLDLIEGVNPDGTLKYVGSPALFKCEACQTFTPGDFLYCPKCGAYFGEEEDKKDMPF